MMLSCRGQSAVVVSGVTTYQSSQSAVGRAGRHRGTVYQTGQLMEWCSMSKGVGRWGSGGKRGSRV